jgi:hypothetical protein
MAAMTDTASYMNLHVPPDNERAVFDIAALLDATLEFQPPAGQA